jgi:hypothetical protein
MLPLSRIIFNPNPNLSPLLAQIKFEPIFFMVLWQFFNPKRSASKGGQAAIWGGGWTAATAALSFLKIGSYIFKCSQPIIKWAVFQHRPPADFPMCFYLLFRRRRNGPKAGLTHS